MEKEKTRGAGLSRRRKSDPGGTKRKLIEEDEDEEMQPQSSEHADDGMAKNDASFDLFSFGEDEHPEMEKLMTLGGKKMEMLDSHHRVRGWVTSQSISLPRLIK